MPPSPVEQAAAALIEAVEAHMRAVAMHGPFALKTHLTALEARKDDLKRALETKP